MHEVEELPCGRPCRTRIWISARARQLLLEFTQKQEKDRGRFLKNLQRYAQAGFENFIGNTKDIRSEGGGVYRIGCRNALFRLIGFFEDPGNFIVLDAFNKSGQKLTSRERTRVEAVLKVHQENAYRKKDYGDYPRLAEGT